MTDEPTATGATTPPPQAVAPQPQATPNQPPFGRKGSGGGSSSGGGGRGRGQNSGGGRGGPRGGGGGGRGGPRGGRGGSREPSEYEEEVLQIDRVTRVVKGGRRLRFRATVVVGNKKGKVGIGIGKSHEVVGAIKKAIHQAKKDFVIVPLKHGTLPHEIFIKFKSARILMMPAAPGTGIIAGGAVRKIAELAGVKNMLSKMFGCSNRLTNAQATIMALKKLKPAGRPEA